MSTLCDMYVIDKTTGRIHRIGDERHDGIWIEGNRIHYYNLQNGDGGTIEDIKVDGYCILRSDCGMLEDEYGIMDKRFEKEIRRFLESKS